MKKKLYITRTIKIVAFALAVILTTYLLQAFILKRIDNNTLRMEGFFEEDKETLDAVFIGASDVYAGYAAPLAYEKYGITSYPFATQSSPPQVLLSQIKEVIKYQNPKLIVVEVNSYTYKDNDLPTEPSHRMFIDNVPRDEIWREYISSVFPEDKQLEFYLPIVKYHGSWTDYPWKIKYLMADLSLRSRGFSLFRGFKTVANEFHSPEKTYNDKLADDDSTMPIGVTSERYLTETLDYLRDNNITNVVFARFPHIVRKMSYSRFQRCNAIQNLIESYGYDFINLERYGVEEGFEIDKDFYNWDHLNIYGSEKLTDYFCQKMIKDYGITPHELSDEKKAEWNVSVSYYHMIYNYCQEMINRRLKLGKTGNGGTVVSEDQKSIDTIKKYAEKTHPELLEQINE